MFLLLQYIIIAFIVWIIMKLCQVYYSASPKHRKELVQPTLFLYNYTLELPFLIPRAFMSLFHYFEGRPAGLSFHGVQTLIYNSSGQLLLGKREPTRAKKWLYDVGAAGMISGMVNSINDIVRTAKEELKEETDISPSANNKLVYVKKVTPAIGYPCIVHIFHITVPDDIQPISNDGTYESMNWVSKHYLKQLTPNQNARLFSRCTELLVDGL